MKSWFHHLLRKMGFILCLSFLSAIFIIQGCGGSGSSSGGNGGTSGQAFIGLTDDAGDFTNYTVDVTRVTLYKASGALVQTLPLRTSVDFAQLTDVTEFLTAATVPSGTYTKVVLTLDYSSAKIAVENSLGEAVDVPIANILDEDGTPITQPLDITLELDDTSSSLVIVPGVPAHLSLDFDLSASNTVTFTGDVPTLTVSPSLKADLQPDSDKIQRLRGPLKDVDVSDSSFDLILRPFAHDLKKHERDFGTIKVAVNDTTVYDINGMGYQGAAGLAALNDLNTSSPYTAVIAHGRFEATPGLHFVASEVLAGSSVPGGTMDAARGTVLSRSAHDASGIAVLTIKGAGLMRKDGTIVYNKDITVTLGAATKVSRQFSKDVFTEGDISVGQRILVSGTLDASGTRMDATNGYARMYLTTLSGHSATPAAPEKMAMNLKMIDFRKISRFDFTGTGSDAAHDAAPAHYVIDPGALTVPLPGESIAVRGFVSPFGQAGSLAFPADFTAQTIIRFTDVISMMNVGWGSGSTTAMSVDLGAQTLTLDLTDARFFHYVNKGCVIIDLGSTTPVIIPSGNPSSRFRINQAGGSQVYSSFSLFLGALQTSLAGKDRVKHIHAWGTFDEATATMTATSIIVKLG